MITPSFGLTATERVLPKLALDFTTASLDARVTFTRTTDATHPATYFNSSGYITAATNNQARFDYDPLTLACKGLLIEESRTNVQINSNDFNSWAKTSITVTIDPTEVSPDGLNNANKLTLTSTLGTVSSNPSILLTAAPYTFSVYAKKGNTDYVLLRLRSATDVAFVRFNLATGVVASTTAGSGAITPVGNGWYRCTVTGTATAANYTAFIYPNNNSGQSIGEYVFCFGAQLEAGAFATSYIPTTTTALTRNADVAVMTGTDFSDWFNASEGTFEFRGATNAVTSYFPLALSLYDGTSANRMTMGYYNFNNFQVVASSVVQCGITTTTPATGVQTTTTAAYKLNSFAASTNASNTVVDTSGTLPTVDQLRIGAYLGGNNQMFNGPIQRLFYYNQRLTNAEVQAFSKG